MKEAVAGAFNEIAHQYDFFTGLNPGYRRHLRLSAERLGLGPRARVLDLCCGTGLSTSALRSVYPDARISALDGSAGMLSQAKRKGVDARFFLGDATDPASYGVEGEFDGILMAYGIRNVPEPDRCLANLRTLLKPGGRIGFHEYSVADSRMSRAVWNAVTLGVIIPGGVLAGGADLYRYLRRSVNEFDGVRAFETRLARAGFADVRTLPMDGWQRGIVHSFLAQRPLTR